MTADDDLAMLRADDDLAMLRAAWDACRAAVADADVAYRGQAAGAPEDAIHGLAVAVHMAAQDLQGAARHVLDSQRHRRNWGWTRSGSGPGTQQNPAPLQEPSNG